MAYRRWLCVVAITAVSAAAAAHVAPSVDDNNRYLKLTPLGDRVRLAYTVLFGEVPGRTTRQTMDTNRDGQIGDDEARRFGNQLAAQVAAALDVNVDGAQRPVTWAIVDVGLAGTTVEAGSFSVDMVAYLCLPSARGHHAVQLRDRFRVPDPGETEVKIEPGPDVAIERARVGGDEMPEMLYRIVGPGGSIEDPGIDLQFTAGPRAVVADDGTCALEPASSSRLWLWLALGGSAAAAATTAAVVVSRRKRRA